jgi:hypothetical protein
MSKVSLLSANNAILISDIDSAVEALELKVIIFPHAMRS